MDREQDSLFSSAAGPEPLASRMRPRTIDEYIGQDHIMGPGRLLRRAIQADQLSSVIFYGPPGTGKTTLARVIANSTSSGFISLNAVLAGVADVRDSIEQAKRLRDLHGRRTILFVDEVHRWNKSQQDALLPWVENGTFILVGATTENPYFEVNAALVSRSRIFQLKPLGPDDLRAIAAQALADPVRGYGRWHVELAADALEHLIEVANGDARSLLNAIELAVETTPAAWPPEAGRSITVDLATAEESIQQKALLYDREGDYHFDTISAFIKSVRGSDPDAALYWLARMVRSGESPRFIFRRLLVSASEDIGLADPQALVQVQNAAAAFERVGLPEGQYFLAQATIYLATAPKSNSTLGYFDALKAVEEAETGEVPNHLRDSSRDKKGFGHGEGYRYPHAYRDHWVAQDYLPTPLRGQVFYQPGSLGHEGSLKPLILERRELQLAETAAEAGAEILTTGPEDRDFERFARRTDKSADTWLRDIRDAVFNRLQTARHHRLAVVGPESAWWLPEALRRAPEGFAYALIPEVSIERCRATMASAGHEQRFVIADWTLLLDTSANGRPERYAGFNVLSRLGADASAALLSRLASVATPDARLVMAEQIPRLAPRLSSLLPEADATLLARARELEDRLYAPLADEAELLSRLAGGPWQVAASSRSTMLRPRTLNRPQLAAWLDTSKPDSYGAALAAGLGPEDFETWRRTLERTLVGRPLPWPVEILLIEANLAP